MGVEVDPRVHQSVEVVEAPRRRQEPPVDAQIPLAINPAHVAGHLQHFRQQNFARVHAADSFEGHGVLGRRVPLAVVGGLVANHVVHAVTLRVAARQQAASTGRAGGPRDVEIRQACAFRRQAVQVRRDRLVAAEAAVVLLCRRSPESQSGRSSKLAINARLVSLPLPRQTSLRPSPAASGAGTCASGRDTRPAGGTARARRF